MRLTNIRRDGQHVRADFTISDGRTGSVAVPHAQYEAIGEEALMQEAMACARLRAHDGHVAPGQDRFGELG